MAKRQIPVLIESADLERLDALVKRETALRRAEAPGAVLHRVSYAEIIREALLYAGLAGVERRIALAERRITRARTRRAS